MIGATQALLVIDVQKGFDDPVWGQRNHPDAEAKGRLILDHWRAAGGQVVIVRHDSRNPVSTLRPGQPGNDLKPGFEPQDGDWLIGKHVNSALIGTDLEARLRAAGITDVTLFGLTTDQCVSTTARMASNLGFATTVVDDACACFAQTAFDGGHLSAEAIHKVHITTLLTEFASITTTADLIRSYR